MLTAKDRVVPTQEIEATKGIVPCGYNVNVCFLCVLTLFLLLSTGEDILKNVSIVFVHIVRTLDPFDFHCMTKKAFKVIVHPKMSFLC